MRILLNEYAGSFGISFEAEDLKDAALLIRFARNATEDIRSLNAGATSDGSVSGWLTLGKRRKDRSFVR